MLLLLSFILIIASTAGEISVEQCLECCTKIEQDTVKEYCNNGCEWEDVDPINSNDAITEYCKEEFSNNAKRRGCIAGLGFKFGFETEFGRCVEPTSSPSFAPTSSPVVSSTPTASPTSVKPSTPTSSPTPLNSISSGSEIKETSAPTVNDTPVKDKMLLPVVLGVSGTALFAGVLVGKRIKQQRSKRWSGSQLEMATEINGSAKSTLFQKNNTQDTFQATGNTERAAKSIRYVLNGKRPDSVVAPTNVNVEMEQKPVDKAASIRKTLKTFYKKHTPNKPSEDIEVMVEWLCSPDADQMALKEEMMRRYNDAPPGW